MRIISLIARVLLGLIFVVFGLNAFLQFIPMGGMPTGLAGQFSMALFQSHYLWVVAGLQILGGLLMFANRFVPLGLVILGPIIVNILLYHFLLSMAGVPLALVATVLWFIVFYAYRRAFDGILGLRGRTRRSARNLRRSDRIKPGAQPAKQVADHGGRRATCEGVRNKAVGAQPAKQVAE
jgi:putative oxidoreductase